MTANFDVIVVGGGVVGCSAAYYLAREGASVALFERDSVAGHASGFAFGGVIKALGGRADDPLDRLFDYSEGLHIKLGASLNDESGMDTGYRRNPHVSLARTEHEADFYRQVYRRHAGDHSRDVRWLRTASLRTSKPAFRPTCWAACTWGSPTTSSHIASRRPSGRRQNDAAGNSSTVKSRHSYVPEPA